MKFTLLEMTQEILSSMDSDEVNAIDDTPESLQVATIIRRCYLDIASRLNLNEHFDFFKLTASGDSSLPTVMYRPDSVDQLLWIKYDKKLAASDPSDFKDVRYLEPQVFLERMFGLNSSETNVSTSTLTIGADDYTLLYKTNSAPNYWTSVDDYTLLFDSYNSDLDTTLQNAKTHCYGLLNTSFTLSDTFVPDLDSQQFSLLINDAKALAWAELKQATHARAERESKRQYVRALHNKRALPSNHAYGEYFNLPDYGRK